MAERDWLPAGAVRDHAPVTCRRFASALCALAGAVSVVSGCSSGGGAAAPTVADVTKLLARRDASVAARSQSAFLADVDASTAAFRTRETQTFQALAQLAPQTWHESVSAPVTDSQSTAAAAKRYGAPALIVHVQVRYQLHGIDPLPSSHDVWWTFVRRHGHVLIAGDDDLVHLGGASWQAPWDFGPLTVATGVSSVVLAPQADAGRATALAADADRAVAAVNRVWAAPWPRRVAVVVASSPAELSTVAASTVTADASAVTVSDPRDPLTQQLPGLRIVLNPAHFDGLTAAGTDIVLRHEITHVATASATGQASPRWLVEGMAEYVANLTSGIPVGRAAAELRTAIGHGHVPTALPSDEALQDAATAAQSYEQAWLACRLIALRAGQGGLERFYRLVGASASAPEAAVSSAMHSVVHESTAQFTRRWRAYLLGQLI